MLPRAEQVIPEAHVWEDRHAGELRLRSADTRLEARRTVKTSPSPAAMSGTITASALRGRMRRGQRRRKSAWTVLGAVTRREQVFLLPAQKPRQKTKRPRRPGLARGRRSALPRRAPRSRRASFGRTGSRPAPLNHAGARHRDVDPELPRAAAGPSRPTPSELSRMITHAPRLPMHRPSHFLTPPRMVTNVPLGNSAWHVGGQSMPGGSLVTCSRQEPRSAEADRDRDRRAETRLTPRCPGRHQLHCASAAAGAGPATEEAARSRGRVSVTASLPGTRRADARRPPRRDSWRVAGHGPGPLTERKLVVVRTKVARTVFAASTDDEAPRGRSHAAAAPVVEGKETSGIAPRETTAPRRYRAEQRWPQWIRPSRLATVPSPSMRTPSFGLATDAPATDVKAPIATAATMGRRKSGRPIGTSSCSHSVSRAVERAST